MNEICKPYDEKMKKTIEVVKSDFASVRAGRANASVLDRIQVEYYGTPTPIQQVASISTPDPRTLAIQPWDASILRDIERAIQSSDLGINPQNDGRIIRLSFPQLTQERRVELTCRKKDGKYYIVTDRWQTYTRVALSEEILTMLSSFCDEFLIHGVDVEGKRSGIEQELIGLLGRWNRIPITYAGGIRSLEDIEQIRKAGQNKIHITVGSALDLYGGDLPFEKVLAACEQ